MHVNSKINQGHLLSPTLAKVGQGNKKLGQSWNFEAAAFTFFTILSREESLADALARVPVKLPVTGTVAGTEVCQV